jgi:hypothetical protein
LLSPSSDAVRGLELTTIVVAAKCFPGITMSNKELERRVGRLEKTLASYAAELRFAYNYLRPDAGSSLTKSRIILEKVVVQVYLTEIGREPKKPLLGDMLADNPFTRKLDRRILSRMNAIRDLGNLGPHGEYVEESDAARVLDDLCEVLDWYLPRYGQQRPPADPERGRRKRESAEGPVAEEKPTRREPDQTARRSDPSAASSSRVSSWDLSEEPPLNKPGRPYLVAAVYVLCVVTLLWLILSLHSRPGGDLSFAIFCIVLSVLFNASLLATPISRHWKLRRLQKLSFIPLLGSATCAGFIVFFIY